MLSCFVFITTQRVRCSYGYFTCRETEATGNANNLPKGTWPVSKGPRVQAQVSGAMLVLFVSFNSFRFLPSNSRGGGTGVRENQPHQHTVALPGSARVEEVRKGFQRSCHSHWDPKVVQTCPLCVEKLIPLLLRMWLFICLFSLEHSLLSQLWDVLSWHLTGFPLIHLGLHPLRWVKV